MDVASVLRSVHREKLSLHVAGSRRALPAWAEWLIWLGLWMRAQTPLDGRRVAVVRLPTRRLSAAFVSLGALLSGLRLHDDSLNWETLQALPQGTIVHWRDDKGGKYSGTVGESREIAGSMFLSIEVAAPKRARGTFLLPKATALTYAVTLGTATARAEERLTAAADLLRSVVDEASLTWIRSPGSDATLVTERTSFIGDLAELSLASGPQKVAVADALVAGDARVHQHGKLQLVPARSETFSDAEGGLTILDGPAAALRIANSRARSIVLLFDHSEYDEEISNLLAPFVNNSVDGGVHLPPGGVVAPPPGVEPFIVGVRQDSNA
jgi:hypothetical protein